VAVKDAGGAVLAVYAYDGLGRRVTESAGGVTTDLYYSAAWQVLEERVGGVAKAQYVWSPVYVDALVERDRDADGSAANGLEERLYALQDANWNVTALVEAAGQVVERYVVFGPYGGVRAYDAAWAERTGGSLYGWAYRFQGLRYDAAAGLYHARHRDYSPGMGRWLQADPIGFAAGDQNLYRFVGNSPASYTDPSGLQGRPTSTLGAIRQGIENTFWNAVDGLAPGRAASESRIKRAMGALPPPVRVPDYIPHLPPSQGKLRKVLGTKGPTSEEMWYDFVEETTEDAIVVGAAAGASRLLRSPKCPSRSAAPGVRVTVV
jgi:RHS repeat-associated protein